jgi:hypothetical protein
MTNSDRRSITLLVAAMVLPGCKSEPTNCPDPPAAQASDAPAPTPRSAGPKGAVNEREEPKLSFTVRVGTAELHLAEGEEAPAGGAFTNPSIAVRVKPERTFTYAGLRFEYPRSFNFEADLSSDDAHSWTLSGSDLKIMVFRLGAVVPVEDFAKDLADQYGAGTTISPVTVKLGDREYAGRRVQARLASHEFIQDVLPLPPLGDRGRFVILQDAASQPGAESQSARTLLVRTFRIEN